MVQANLDDPVSLNPFRTTKRHALSARKRLAPSASGHQSASMSSDLPDAHDPFALPETVVCSAKRGSRSYLVVPGRCGWFRRRDAPVGSSRVPSALRTTAGRGQQGPHISEVSSKHASLNPPKYKRILTKESKEINVFSLLFTMKPMISTKI